MNQLINNALTQETPGKVMALVGTALFSLAFMVAVSLSNASFSQVYSPVPNPFSADNVVAAIDTTAATYDQFLSENLFQPLSQTYALWGDNLAWVGQNSGLAYALGLDEGSSAVTPGQVAGAYIERSNYQQSKSPGVMDVIYSVLLK